MNAGFIKLLRSSTNPEISVKIRSVVTQIDLLRGRPLKKQETFEKCWAHSPREPPHAQSAGVASGTVDVHDANDNDDNDDA